MNQTSIAFYWYFDHPELHHEQFYTQKTKKKNKQTNNKLATLACTSNHLGFLDNLKFSNANEESFIGLLTATELCQRFLLRNIH